MTDRNAFPARTDPAAMPNVIPGPWCWPLSRCWPWWRDYRPRGSWRLSGFAPAANCPARKDGMPAPGHQPGAAGDHTRPRANVVWHLLNGIGIPSVGLECSRPGGLRGLVCRHPCL